MHREPVGEDHVDDPRVLAYSSVLARFCDNTLFGDSDRSSLYSPSRISVFCKESSCNPTREGVRLPRPINIKAKAD